MLKRKQETPPKKCLPGSPSSRRALGPAQPGPPPTAGQRAHRQEQDGRTLCLPLRGAHGAARCTQPRPQGTARGAAPAGTVLGSHANGRLDFIATTHTPAAPGCWAQEPPDQTGLCFAADLAARAREPEPGDPGPHRQTQRDSHGPRSSLSPSIRGKEEAGWPWSLTEGTWTVSYESMHEHSTHSETEGPWPVLLSG